jgi:hypothetical protein
MTTVTRSVLSVSAIALALGLIFAAQPVQAQNPAPTGAPVPAVAPAPTAAPTLVPAPAPRVATARVSPPQARVYRVPAQGASGYRPPAHSSWPTRRWSNLARPWLRPN